MFLKDHFLKKLWVTISNYFYLTDFVIVYLIIYIYKLVLNYRYPHIYFKYYRRNFFTHKYLIKSKKKKKIKNQVSYTISLTQNALEYYLFSVTDHK